jgi:hypothetical protein
VLGLETAMPTNLPHGTARMSPSREERRRLLALGILALTVLALAILALGLSGLIGLRGSIAPDDRDRFPQPRSNQYHGEYSPAEIFRRYAR